jgi:hypothetical protein
MMNVFWLLQSAARRYLARCSRIIDCSRDDILYRTGDVGQYFYIVLAGEVELCRSDAQLESTAPLDRLHTAPNPLASHLIPPSTSTHLDTNTLCDTFFDARAQRADATAVEALGGPGGIATANVAGTIEIFERCV